MKPNYYTPLLAILLIGMIFISGCIQRPTVKSIELGKSDFRGCLFPEYNNIKCEGYLIKDERLWLLVTNNNNETIFVKGLGCNLKTLGTSYDVQEIPVEIVLESGKTAFIPSSSKEGESPSESSILCKKDVNNTEMMYEGKRYVLRGGNLRFALRYKSESDPSKILFRTIVATVEEKTD